MAETVINKNQTGSGIWTSDNLVGGTNITIAQKQVANSTLGLFHFDTLDSTNSAPASNYTVFSIPNIWRASLVDGKFSNAIRINSTYDQGITFLTDNNATASDDYTLDFWIKPVQTTSGTWINFGPGTVPGSFYINNNTISYYDIARNINVAVQSNIDNTTWYHLAIELYKSSTYYYIDGTMVAALAYTASQKPDGKGIFLVRLQTNSIADLDEVRISNVARYKGQDFSVPTAPYIIDTPPAVYEINNTQDLSSKQDILTSATGYDETKTQVLKNVNGTLTWVDE